MLKKTLLACGISLFFLVNTVQAKQLSTQVVGKISDQLLAAQFKKFFDHVPTIEKFEIKEFVSCMDSIPNDASLCEDNRRSKSFNFQRIYAKYEIALKGDPVGRDFHINVVDIKGNKRLKRININNFILENGMYVKNGYVPIIVPTTSNGDIQFELSSYITEKDIEQAHAMLPRDPIFAPNFVSGRQPIRIQPIRAELRAKAKRKQLQKAHITALLIKNGLMIKKLPPNSVILNKTVSIISIGDSFASGEGAADDNGSFNATNSSSDVIKCHRSNFAPSQVAIDRLRLNMGDIGTDIRIEFTNVACAGATINAGLLASYEGVVPNGNLIESQIDQAKDFLDETLTNSGLNNADIVLVTIGGNDVGFGAVVGACALYKMSDFNPAQHFLNLPSEFSPQECNNNLKLQELLDNGKERSTRIIGFSKFNAEFDRLKDRLDEVLHPNKVIITGYPDALTYRDVDAISVSVAEMRNDGTLKKTREDISYVNKICYEVNDDHVLPIDAGILLSTFSIEKALLRVEEDKKFLGFRTQFGLRMRHVNREEYRWVKTNLMDKLNNKLKEMSDDNNWIFLDKLNESTSGHGLCAGFGQNRLNRVQTTRWFNTFKDSSEDQLGNISGAVHPNRTGYEAIADVIKDKLLEELKL